MIVNIVYVKINGFKHSQNTTSVVNFYSFLNLSFLFASLLKANLLKRLFLHRLSITLFLNIHLINSYFLLIVFASITHYYNSACVRTISSILNQYFVLYFSHSFLQDGFCRAFSLIFFIYENFHL